MALFGLVLHRQASLARKWPVVPGAIKSSGLEQFMSAPSDSTERSQLTFQSKVSFAYRFNGIDYVSEHASLGGKVSSTSRGSVERFARKYPNVGAKVQSLRSTALRKIRRKPWLEPAARATPHHGYSWARRVTLSWVGWQAR